MKLLTISFFLLFALKIRAQSTDRAFDTIFLKTRPVTKAAANPQLEAGAFTRFLLGKKYRDEWTTPVTAPIINFQKDFGGLEIDKPGGGKQTHSLHLKDAQDRKIFLRSVRKYPTKALPPELTNTIAERIVFNEISASYPYGVFSVAPLSHAAGVPYYPNKLTYLTQNSLKGDKYQEYADDIYLLELRQLSTNGKAIKTYDTDEMVDQVYNSDKSKIDEVALLRERLLDNFIMDFDRHEGQYDWGKRDSADFTVYYPIPKDRDQAFFKSGGFLPSILSKMQAFHQLQGLHADTKHISSFNYAARNLDRAFLTSLDKYTWKKEIDRFLKSMTDSVIDLAIAQQPQEIQSLSSTLEIADILKKKRQFFRKDLLNYYEALAERVTITGTNGREQFDVTRFGDGTLEVTVHALKDDGSFSHQTYRRVFYPDETEEVQLYGLEGDDRFVVHGKGSDIRIRLIGGPGNDHFVNEGNKGKIWVYDVSYENNSVEGHNMHRRISSDPLNNEYRRLSYGFDSHSPRIAVDYSRDGGLFLGLGILIIRHGFRMDPYSSKQFASVMGAINSKSYQMLYNGEFLQLIRGEDLLVHGSLQLPTSRTRFYGYGNETKNLYKGKEGQYYLASYTWGEASVLARHHFTPWLSIQYGPQTEFLRLSDDHNHGNYISTVFPIGEGEEGLTAGKWYVGGQVSAIVDARNSPLFTTRGTAVKLYASRLQDLTANTGGFTEVGGVASFYTDFLYKRHVVLATSFGAAHNMGTFSFPQAQYLGFKENLRGYRMQRFAGHSRAYNNTELRVNFGTLNLYLIKGPFGILGFHDIGRVWADGENSSEWHRGYGGGLWMAPFNKVVLTGLVTYSKEEKNFVDLNIGFKF
jgi:hypothetical protein